MAVIKQSSSAMVMRDAIVLDLGDLRRQGETILSRAREEAARIVEQGKIERARLIQNAASEGRAEGLAEGLARGHEQGMAAGREAALNERRESLQQLEGAWVATLQDFVSRREELIDDARKDVLRLACIIAGRVIKRQVELDPSIAVDQLEAVLGMVMRPSRLKIAVHPLDRPLVEAALPGLAQRYGSATHTEIVEDATVSRGSCSARVSEGDGNATLGGAGMIDATIETQLTRIVEALLPDARA